MQDILADIPLDLGSGILLDNDKIKIIRKDAEDEEGGMTEAEWEIYLTQIDNNTWAQIRDYIGDKMTPTLNGFITKLENDQIIQDFQSKKLVPHVKAYTANGGEVSGPPEA